MHVGREASIYKVWFQTPVGKGLLGRAHASWKLIEQCLARLAGYGQSNQYGQCVTRGC